MECKQCNKVIESLGTKPKLFCSGACRKKWARLAAKRMEQTDKRTEQTDTIEQTDAQPEQADTNCTVEAQDQESEMLDTLAALPLTLHELNAQASGKGSVINTGAFKPAHLLGKREYNRVTLPGDSDYAGVYSG